MNHKLLILCLLFLGMNLKLFPQQKEFIQIEVNKTLCLFSFLETASEAPGTSRSFHKLIHDNLAAEEAFGSLVEAYKQIKFNYHFQREEFPENRHSYREIKDLIWVAASYAEDLEDFNQRIVGYLPHASHKKLLSIMKGAEPYYDRLVWNNEQENIARIKEQLSTYKGQIEDLFLRVSKFYGTEWSKEVPFRILLYPIPLDRGYTTAIPKGNALICSFLSKNENDYEGRLGVIIHEMCHILFDEQRQRLQQDIDKWFMKSESDWSKLAYSYLDEGLATAIGNGWAFEQIHGKLDSTDWYNDKYINGFAKSLFADCSAYLNQGREIDKDFIVKGIAHFEKTFPKAIYELEILMNEITLFANSEKNDDVEYISYEMRRNFRIRSQWFSTPIADERTLRLLDKKQTTKFFLIEQKHQASIQLIREQFQDLDKELDPNKNFIYSFKDQKTKSPVIMLNLHDLDDLEKALKTLRSDPYLEFGELVVF
ncbi:MAG: hypothetical protein AAFY45_08875 [Bacteroidota bacterium]